jgi:hypothetical protein
VVWLKLVSQPVEHDDEFIGRKVDGEVRHAMRQENPSVAAGFDPQDGAQAVSVAPSADGDPG